MKVKTHLSFSDRLDRHTGISGIHPLRSPLWRQEPGNGRLSRIRHAAPNKNPAQGRVLVRPGARRAYRRIARIYSTGCATGSRRQVAVRRTVVREREL